MKIRNHQLDYLLNEKKRIQVYHENEEQRLLDLLKNLDDDEAEKFRILQLWEELNRVKPQPVGDNLEHFADGNVDLNTL